MQLVEQQVISRADPSFAVIDAAAFQAKNLYNAANYLVRQALIFAGRYLGYAAIFHLIKHHDAYTALPRKVSNDILRQLDKNGRAFFAACAAYREDPSKFVSRPKVPKYKDKAKGRFLLTYDRHTISRRALRCGRLRLSGLDLDPLPVYDQERDEQPAFSGKRVARGVYRRKSGRRIQAEVNASYNIGRKAFPHSFGQEIEAALAVRPVALPISTVIPSRAGDRAAVLRMRA